MNIHQIQKNENKFSKYCKMKTLQWRQQQKREEEKYYVIHESVDSGREAIIKHVEEKKLKSNISFPELANVFLIFQQGIYVVSFLTVFYYFFLFNQIF